MGIGVALPLLFVLAVTHSAVGPPATAIAGDWLRVVLVALFPGVSGDQTKALVAFALFVTAIIFGVATISNNNLQDLKTGQLVGATPWKQQVALIIGVIYGAAAGYFGGRIDSIMMRIVDVLYAIPYMMIVIVLLAFFGGQSPLGQLFLLQIILLY